jgi:hypothetical protein
MSKRQVKLLCENIQKYSIDRMCDLCEESRYEDATSMYEEIKEWLIEKDKPVIWTMKRISDGTKPKS